MSHVLVLRRAAQDDIDDAALWYDAQHEGLGLRFLDEVENILDHIRDMPARFTQLEGTTVRRANLNKFPYGVYFLPHSRRVVVLGVLHLRRQLDTWKRRT